MKTKTPLLTKLAYSTAIALAAFSGGVATFGLCKLVPGGEVVVAGMGVLFEAAKLTSFSLLHRPLPRLLKVALAGVGVVLMTANVAGVSGFLSGAYERSQIHATAVIHMNETGARASASLVERQLAAAEQNLAAGRAALIKARGDRGRVKGAQAVIITTTTAERDALIRQLGTAEQLQAKAEGSTIEAGSEIAAISFLAAATGSNPDTVARVAITTISALPDLSAVLLLLAARYKPTKAPVVRRRQPARRVRRAPLKVVQNAQAA
jgi:hypothetical protein